MPLELEIEAYNKMRDELEKEHMGKWVLFHNQQLAGVFDDSSMAAEEAVRSFGRGPYLIRQVGAPLVTLPASVLFFPAYVSS